MMNDRYPHSQWRVVQTLPTHGDWNMAVDEAILEASARGDVSPTLRLFAWEPPCLSIGYAQPITDVDRQRLTDKGWELVRRPTGGRAILHTDELTYSVIGPSDEPRLTGSVLECYRRLSSAMVDALHRLNIPAEVKETRLHTDAILHTRSTDNPVCFDVPSEYEILVDGKKLIGSAQARRKQGVLQHGSLPLTGDLSRILEVLYFTDESMRRQAAIRLQERATTAHAILDYRLTWEACAQSFCQAFEDVLNLSLVPSDLTPAEQTRALELVHEKYGNPTWTGRV